MSYLSLEIPICISFHLEGISLTGVGCITPCTDILKLCSSSGNEVPELQRVLLCSTIALLKGDMWGGYLKNGSQGFN